MGTSDMRHLHAPPARSRNGSEVAVWLILLQEVHDRGEEHCTRNEEYAEHAQLRHRCMERVAEDLDGQVVKRVSRCISKSIEA